MFWLEIIGFHGDPSITKQFGAPVAFKRKLVSNQAPILAQVFLDVDGAMLLQDVCHYRWTVGYAMGAAMGCPSSSAS